MAAAHPVPGCGCSQLDGASPGTVTRRFEAQPMRSAAHAICGSCGRFPRVFQRLVGETPFQATNREKTAATATTEARHWWYGKENM